MLIDTHAHLNFNAFKNDIDEVIQRSLKNNIWMINIGSNYETSKKAVEIAEKYQKGVYAAIGLHPIYKEENFDFQKYKELAKSKKVVAVGEIGLDYYRRPKTTKKKEIFKQKQKELFLKQLELARELNLPVIFHCRMAHQNLYEILNSKLRGVIHGFVGTVEELEKYLKLGFSIGFNGMIFKNIERVNFEKLISKTPLKKILIETDCPFLTPPPFENQRNEPLYIKYIAEKIAKIKNSNFEKIIRITTENAKELFKIK